MAHQLSTDVAASVHEVDCAGREARLVQHLDEQVGADRCDLRRLPDQRATECQAINDGNTRDINGEVPRTDRGHHADRFLHDHDPLRAVALLRGGQDLAAVANDIFGSATEVIDGELFHLLDRLTNRLAGLARDHLGDLRITTLADLEGVSTNVDARHQWRTTPSRESIGSSLDGRLQLRTRSGIDRADEAVVPRAMNLDQFALARVPLARDERPWMHCRHDSPSILTTRIEAA